MSILLVVLAAFLAVWFTRLWGDGAGGADGASDQPSAGSSLCSDSSEGDPLVGWGPDRPIYTDNTFPDSLTFNSTYINPNIGDERNFVSARDADGNPDELWQDRIEVAPGETYRVRAYIRLDGPIDQVAEGVRLRFTVPECRGHRIGISATLEASNVYPRQVWDGMEFWSREDFAVSVVPDSVILESNLNPGPPGAPLSTLALTGPDGVDPAFEHPGSQMPPGYGTAKYVSFLVLISA